MDSQKPSVEVIIPHYRGVAMLERCLCSLSGTSYAAMSICIVDNSGGEEELAGLAGRFERLRVVSLLSNKGYAGGCNRGLFSSPAKYVVFMNDDTAVDPLWLDYLVEAAEADGTIAVLQPKILSLQAERKGKKVFDYAGAAGGLIDRLGYPYCYGRTFFRTENDHGQYDHEQDIFWASGVAMFARREIAADLGGFDEDFFMHMEEIDLCWRIRLRGYRVFYVPEAVVYHEGGASLAERSPEKRYLNHRNNIAMLLKNMSAATLAWVFPVRLLLECAAAALYFAKGPYRARSALSVFRAFRDNITQMRRTFSKRREVQGLREVSDIVLFHNAPVSILFKRKIPA